MAELRFAPPVASMLAFIEPQRAWIESVVGCSLSEALTLEFGAPFGELVAEDLLEGVPLDKGCLGGGEALRPKVARWALPPAVSPRIELYQSRRQDALITSRQWAWDPHWKDTPVAVWFHGLQHAAVRRRYPTSRFNAGRPVRGRDGSSSIDWRSPQSSVFFGASSASRTRASPCSGGGTWPCLGTVMTGTGVCSTPGPDGQFGMTSKRSWSVKRGFDVTAYLSAAGTCSTGRQGMERLASSG